MERLSTQTIEMWKQSNVKMTKRDDENTLNSSLVWNPESGKEIDSQRNLDTHLMKVHYDEA